MAMQREEKTLDTALEAMVSRVTELKATLTQFLLKLEHEHETLTWPTVLDNFALLSGHVNTLLKVIRNDKMPPLRNLAVLPLQLTPDRDEELVKLTENRVVIFNHEMVPDYLRTKPDPDVEQREQQLMHKSMMIPMDLGQKQVASMNKFASNILDVVGKIRDEWDSEAGARSSVPQTSSPADTHALLCAVSMGKGLKPQAKLVIPGAPTVSQTQNHPTNMPGMSSMNKAPSTIKTNIKAATGVHPYGR